MPSTSVSLSAPNEQGERSVVIDCNSCERADTITVTQEDRDEHGSTLGAVAVLLEDTSTGWVVVDREVVCSACLMQEEQVRAQQEEARHPVRNEEG